MIFGCYIFEGRYDDLREEPDNSQESSQAAVVAIELDEIGIDGIGLSGPNKALYKHFGITADARIARAMMPTGKKGRTA